MKCEVIQDLLPLYVEECCSEESATLVEEHLKTCRKCREIYETMSDEMPLSIPFYGETRITHLACRKGAILQSILFVFGFLLLVVGVYQEANTPLGKANGCWSLRMIVPTAGFLLGLCNWYFLQVYYTRRRFVQASVGITWTITAVGYVWAWMHYGFHTLTYEQRGAMIIGVILAVLYGILSGVLGEQYGKMLGKEDGV